VKIANLSPTSSSVVETMATSPSAATTASSPSPASASPRRTSNTPAATRLEIGDNNSIREYVTISRGTTGGGGVTRIGSDCLIMAYTHIGHDSQIGNGCILANSATLAGHVIVEDFAVVGALCPVHQFCRIGRHAYIGGGTTITQDVLPYSLTSIERNNHAYGLNKVGLERKGFTPQQLKELRNAYRTLLASKLNTSDALAAIRDTIVSGNAGEHVAYLADFIATASAASSVSSRHTRPTINQVPHPLRSYAKGDRASGGLFSSTQNRRYLAHCMSLAKLLLASASSPQPPPNNAAARAPPPIRVAVVGLVHSPSRASSTVPRPS
jgi:UDP-N-acetylglucosamine acyltransferase